jgi:hypothetical protein
MFNDRPTFPWDEVVEWGRGCRGRFGCTESILGSVGAVCGIGVFGDSPWEFLELHAVKDDGGGPDVDLTSIVF